MCYLVLQIVFKAHLHNAWGMWGVPASHDQWSRLWDRLAALGYGVFSHDPAPDGDVPGGGPCASGFSVKLDS